MRARKLIFVAESLVLTLPVVLAAIWAGWALSGSYALSDFVNIQLMFERGVAWFLFVAIGYLYVFCMLGLVCGIWLSGKYIFSGSEALRSGSKVPLVLALSAGIIAIAIGILGAARGDVALTAFLLGVPAIVPLGHLHLIRSGRVAN